MFGPDILFRWPRTWAAACHASYAFAAATFVLSLLSARVAGAQPTQRLAAVALLATDTVFSSPSDVASADGCSAWVLDKGRGLFHLPCGGTSLSLVTRLGDGPGGLRHATSLLVSPDGQATVLDAELRRLTMFDGGGRVTSVRGLSATVELTGQSQLLGVRGDTLLLWHVGFPESTDNFVGIVAGTDRIERYWLPGGTTRRLLSLQGTQHFIFRDARASSRFTAPFGSRTLIARMPSGGVVIGVSSESRLRVIPLLDGPVAEINVPLSRYPVTPADRNRRLADLRSEFFEEAERLRYGPEIMAFLNQRWQAIAARMTFGDSHPLFDHILVDSSGEIWLLLPSRSRLPPTTWIVVSATTGAILRVVTVPHRGNIKAAWVSRGTLFTVEESDDQVRSWVIRYR